MSQPGPHILLAPELEEQLQQIERIRDRAARLVIGMSEAAFNWRPEAGAWSIGQCFDHLNITAKTYFERLDAAIERGRERDITGTGPFRYGWLERWFLRSMEPPPKFKSRTGRRFQPSDDLACHETVLEFLRYQEGLIERVRRADGLHLARLSVQSAFVSFLSFSLGITFGLITAHERRHLWQAEQVYANPRFPARRPTL